MIDGQAPVETFAEIDSTLLEARRRAERGGFGPVWLIAAKQSSGRGRRGRAWISGEGNLLATYLFDTDSTPGEVALLGFAAGIAIAESFEAFGARPVTLKWPNDVMIASAKAAGILIDSGAAGSGRIWAALAFGINIAVAPEAGDQPTICLRECSTVPAPSVAVFFAGLRLRLEAWAVRLSEEGFEPLRRAWLARAHGFGAVARVQQGEALLEGELAGLSARGELELDTPSGRRLIAAGDVYFSNSA